MGRPRNGEPYLKGGVYHIRFQGDKGGGTSLNTTNQREARRLGEALARKRGATMPSLVRGGEPAAPRPTLSPPTPENGSNGPIVPSSSGDALGDWLGSDSEFEAGTDRARPDSPTAPPSASREVSGYVSPSPTSGLTSEEKSRMHGLLSGIVGRANVLGLGLAVRIFGRVPAEPEPADMELLNRAWQLQLDELLEGKEIKPYMLIIGASVGLGVGMYAGGEPIPPKPKNPGGAAATVTPLHTVP